MVFNELYISIHALRGEGDPKKRRNRHVIRLFLSTPSAGRATVSILRPKARHDNFYPRPPRGGRQPLPVMLWPLLLFLSTPSAGRATTGENHRHRQEQISIHALRGEGDRRKTANLRGGIEISIHALRGEGDGRWTGRPGGWKISIHALRGEGDVLEKVVYQKLNEFLSTPSAGRATSELTATMPSCENFYPRPPRGGRPPCLPLLRGEQGISIHALRGEGDSAAKRAKMELSRFLSTPSAGRATVYDWLIRLESYIISIHALRGEGDSPRFR